MCPVDALGTSEKAWGKKNVQCGGCAIKRVREDRNTRRTENNNNRRRREIQEFSSEEENSTNIYNLPKWEDSAVSGQLQHRRRERLKQQVPPSGKGKRNSHGKGGAVLCEEKAHCLVT